ncbi:hypothetical protein [Clostridium botulinum]|uniref:hypothetical protein n=1 Tax=Clostridium botulinum TaxID=1491 RepID=UPI001CBDC08A|nr:hypothetical protein [Clostridium botulinum]
MKLTREELIIKTENHIKSIPYFKNQISNIDKKIEDHQMEIDNIQDKNKLLEKERRSFEIQIQKLKNSMNVITEEEQKIICYKYFDNICNAKIGSLLGYSASFCNKRKVENILYHIGKCLFCTDIFLYGLEN